nr:RecName: Full=Neutral phospholipase A2 homolog cannitoxin beta chain 1; Short=svPLA2 homolog [Oxyuranus scutellatus canni]
NLVQFGKMIE